MSFKSRFGFLLRKFEFDAVLDRTPLPLLSIFLVLCLIVGLCNGSTNMHFLVWTFLALLTVPFVYASLRWQQKYAARILLGGLVATLLILLLSFTVLGYFGLVFFPLGPMAILGGLIGLIVKSIRLRLQRNKV